MAENGRGRENALWKAEGEGKMHCGSQGVKTAAILKCEKLSSFLAFNMGSPIAEQTPMLQLSATFMAQKYFYDSSANGFPMQTGQTLVYDVGHKLCTNIHDVRQMCTKNPDVRTFYGSKIFL